METKQTGMAPTGRIWESFERSAEFLPGLWHWMTDSRRARARRSFRVAWAHLNFGCMTKPNEPPQVAPGKSEMRPSGLLHNIFYCTLSIKMRLYVQTFLAL